MADIPLPLPPEVDSLLDTIASLIQAAIDKIGTGTQLWTVTETHTLVSASGGSVQGKLQLTQAIVQPVFVEMDMTILRLAGSLAPLLRASSMLSSRFLTTRAGISIPESSNAETWIRNTLTAPFLRHYLERLDVVRWNEQVFNIVADELRSYLQQPTLTVVITSALQNFSMNRPVLEIWPGLRIENLPFDERKQLYEEYLRMPWTSPQEASTLASIEWAVRQERQVEPRFMAVNSATSDGSWYGVTARLITALRLLTAGNVASHRSWSKLQGPNFTGEGTAFMGTEAYPISLGSTMNLEVTPSTSTSITGLMDKLQHHDSDLGLEVALRRLDSTYSRPLVEDRLIDLWIGLEALFTKGDERAETTDKLARRIARLLGSDQDTRRALQRDVKTLYNYRSRVVHGSEVNQNQIVSATERSTELLREAIRSRLLSQWTVDSIEDQMMA